MSGKRLRLGIITDEVSQRIGEAVDFARRFGLDAIEIRSVNDKPVHLLLDEELEEIKRLAESNGLAVSGIAGPLFKCELDDPAEVEEHLAMADRLIAIAVLMGAPVIRGFSFWAKRPFAEALEDIASQLRKLVPRLEAAGVTLALEFDPSVYASNAAKVSEVLQKVDSPCIRALYDPGNDLWDPEGELPYPDGYEAIKDRICHVHLKDARRMNGENGVEAVAIGTGEVDYRGVFDRLVRDRYEGYMVVETHYRMKSRLTEEQLKRPAGGAFSEGGLEASAHCVRHLYRLLDELGMDDPERLRLGLEHGDGYDPSICIAQGGAEISEPHCRMKLEGGSRSTTAASPPSWTFRRRHSP